MIDCRAIVSRAIVSRAIVSRPGVSRLGVSRLGVMTGPAQVLEVGPGSWPDEFGPEQPGGDLAVPSRIDAVEHPAAVDERATGFDQARPTQDVELAGRRGPAEGDLGCELRGSTASDRQGSHDPPARGISKQGDPFPIPSWHLSLHPAGHSAGSFEAIGRQLWAVAVTADFA